MAALKPLSYRLRAELFTQLAKLEAAGLPFDRAMQSLSLPSADAGRLDAMRTKLAKGIDAAAAGEASGVFTKLESRLIRAALNSGSPAATYQRLGDYYTERAMQLATMKTRFVFPAFLLVGSLVLTPLPALVGGDISIFGYVWQILRPLLVLFGLYHVGRWFLRAGADSAAGSLYTKLPFYGPILLRENYRDFFESLALMLDAGLPVLDALPAAVDTVEDGAIRRDLLRLRSRIEQGGSLTEAMWALELLPDRRVIEFVQTGEASGTLPEMLKRHCTLETEDINGFYEQLASWVPKIVYGLVVMFVAFNLLKGGGAATKI
ncbi:MAG: type II secretion system F family protein [Burkholderiales bacterium]|jgi:general secretion pathway protein F|nr:type II secretion system F family protein [Betaproteobacteria bacterium]